MKKVLVAEDEIAIREMIALNLTLNGYEVLEAGNGNEAMLLFDANADSIDVVLLDIMMPFSDGMTVCRHIRDNNAHVGIIFLSAKSQEADKIEGLQSGADDYITKPFSVSEMIARVEAIYRRVEFSKRFAEKENRDEIVLGDFVLSTIKRAVFHNGERIDLSQIEFQIIEILFSNPNETVSRVEILKNVWGENFFGDDKVVDVNIRRLRMKIEKTPSTPEHLTTVWGVGYKWIP